MKNILYTTATLFCFGSPLVISAQVDARFFYEGTHYTGPNFDLVLGQTVLINTDAGAISINILNPNVAVKATRVDGNGNLFPTTDLANYFVYTEEDMPYVGGTNQYEDINLLVECLPKANNVQELPQPTAWIPVNQSNIKGDTPEVLVIGDRVLMLRRAYLWENSEDVGCCHGPYGSVGLNVHSENLLTDYNFDIHSIAGEYCGAGDTNLVQEGYNSCDSLNCSLFLTKYPTLGGFKLAGQVFNADNLCDDVGQNCGGIILGDNNPSSEWIEWPWGVCYSQVPIFKWVSNSPNNISLVLREGDDTNCDDIMAGILVNKNDTGLILFKAGSFGWIELENLIVTQADIDYNVDIADYYWNYSWDGNNPEEVHSIPQTPPFDQYVPLAGGSIVEMESTFPIGNTVGLIGGKFPKGVLSKPMTYKAACVPAVFGIDSQNRQNGGAIERTNNNSINRQIHLFPNPSSDRVQWSDEFGKKASVLNANGQILLTSIGTNQIDLSLLPSGIYFLRIQDEKGGVQFAKVMKK